MMKCIMASPIECSELSQALELRGSSVLLIDCRSFMDFNCCHISNAHNVHFPPIVKRRSGGSVRLERHILRCPRTRARLQAAHYSLVVVYDHNSTSLADLAEDSNMYLVLRCLSSEDRIHNLRYLAGGFNQFLSQAPHLCYGTKLSESATTLLTAGGRVEESHSPGEGGMCEPGVTVRVSSPSPQAFSPSATVAKLSLASLDSLPRLSPLSMNDSTHFSFDSRIDNLLERDSRTDNPMRRLSPMQSMDCLNLPGIHRSPKPSHRPLSPRYCHSTPSSPYSPNLRCLRHKSLSSYKLKQNSFDTEEPVEILPWLFLGSVEHAHQGDLLQTLGVSALLNVSLAESPQAGQFCCKTIPIADSSTSLINQWFPEAIQFIEMVRQNGGKVLVHCHAGVSRSATICIAYLMYYKHLTMDQAYDYLKARRHIINPNWNFMTQLQEYEKQLNANSEAAITSGVTSSGVTSSVMTSSMTPNSGMKLCLTPLTPVGCNQEAGVFVFDSPIRTPLGSPHHSPLVSPS